MLAYVLLSLKEPEEQTTLVKLQKMKDVKQAHVLFGEWDLIALIEQPSAEALGDFVMQKIRVLPEVKLTSTLIVAR